ncbi:MAG: N-acetyl-gamma-aminoadipyl-phosphate reductase, partial [uncultured Thermomicrobiales bacterium]
GRRLRRRRIRLRRGGACAAPPRPPGGGREAGHVRAPRRQVRALGAPQPAQADRPQVRLDRQARPLRRALRGAATRRGDGQDGHAARAREDDRRPQRRLPAAGPRGVPQVVRGPPRRAGAPSRVRLRHPRTAPRRDPRGRRHLQRRLHGDDRDPRPLPALPGRRGRHVGAGLHRGQDRLVRLGRGARTRLPPPRAQRRRPLLQADRAPPQRRDRPGAHRRRCRPAGRLQRDGDRRGAGHPDHLARHAQGSAHRQGGLGDLPGRLQGRAVHADRQGGRRHPPLPRAEDPLGQQLVRRRLRARPRQQAPGGDGRARQPDEGRRGPGRPGLQHPLRSGRDDRSHLPRPAPDL